MSVEDTIVIFKYRKVKGSITINLVDKNDNNKLLEGAKFKIEKVKENGEVDSSFTPIETKTNDVGMIVLDKISVGNYRITQIDTIQGYNINETKYEVKITKEANNKEVVIENKKIPTILKNVNTGDKVIIISVILFVAMVIFVITALMSNKKRNKRNK